MLKPVSLLDRFIAPARKALIAASKTLTIAVLLICIITTISASIELLAYSHPTVAVIISTVISCIFMIPLTIICLNMFKTSEKAEYGNISQKDQEIKQLTEEKNEYKRRIMLLENISFNRETYQNVLKLCYEDCKKEGTIKLKEQFNEEDFNNPIKKLLGSSSKNYDELLFIIDWVVTYQRGVDLKKIRIAKINNDSVIISGIIPEFTAKPHFEYKDFCTEVRHVKQDKNGEIKQITIESGEKARSILHKKTAEYKKILEENFINGFNPGEDARKIQDQVQDLIRKNLQSIYKNIEFEEKAIPSESMPLLEFLNNETTTYKKMLEP